MKTEMFMISEHEDCTSIKTIRNKHYDLIEEINFSLKDQSYSTSELYQIMIFKGLLKPTYFREFEKIVRLGVRQGLINPNMLVSKHTKGTRLPNFFVKEQWTRFFHNCNNPRTAVTCFLALWCGLRPSEVVKQRITDIDFEGNRIKIVQSKQSKDRFVPFLKEGHDIVKKWIKYSDATDYVFPSEMSHSVATENERHICTTTMRNEFRETLRNAGLDEKDGRYKKQNTPRSKYTFYVWRHSFATYWINKGMSPVFVKEAMGHVKMDTTINVYSHIENKNIVKAMADTREQKTKIEPIKPAKENKKEETNINTMIAERLIKGEITKEQAMEMKQFITQELN
ncbi:MAG: tyrosine-type recombinase/integrase [Nanoarchaeota archaeon]|nr:tyrosine-type recombinase/integrase [Nanoarchaeota archaeon]